MDAQCVLLLCYVLSTWHISPIMQIVFKKLVNTCRPSLRSSGDIRAESAVSSGSVSRQMSPSDNLPSARNNAWLSALNLERCFACQQLGADLAAV
jgi:hypothetical protein